MRLQGTRQIMVTVVAIVGFLSLGGCAGKPKTDETNKSHRFFINQRRQKPLNKKAARPSERT